MPASVGGGNVPLTPSTSITTDIGLPKNIGWLVLENESPYSVQLTMNGIGQFTVPPSVLWPIYTQDADYGWDGSITVMPVADLSVLGAPSFFLRYTTFRPSEYNPIQQVVPLVRSVNAGFNVATSLTNDGNAPHTQILEATPNDQVVPAWLWYNDGSGTLQLLSSGAQRIFLKALRGSIGLPASFQIGDAADPTLLTVYANIINLANFLASTTGTLILSSLQSGAAAGVEMQTWNGAATITPFSIGGQFGAALAFIDASGGVNTPKLWITGGPSAAQIDFESPYVVHRPPESGATALGHIFQAWDGAAAFNILALGASGAGSPRVWIDGSGNISLVGGGITKVQNQATAGTLGIPITVADLFNSAFNLSGGGDHVLSTFSVAVSGMYRANFTLEAGLAGSNIHAGVAYTSAQGGAATNNTFAAQVNGVTTFFTGAEGATGTGVFSCDALTFPAKSSNTITFFYQNQAATVNDHVSFSLERLH